MNIKNVMHTILVYLKRMNTITKMSIWKNVRKKLHADKFKIFNNASPLNKFFVPCTNRPNPKAWKTRRVWFIFTFQYEIFINVTQVFNSRRHFLFVQSYIIQVIDDLISWVGQIYSYQIQITDSQNNIKANILRTESNIDTKFNTLIWPMRSTKKLVTTRRLTIQSIPTTQGWEQHL